MWSDILIGKIVALMLLFTLATTAFAKDAVRKTLDLNELTNLYLVKDTMTGNEIKDYRVFGERSQILSVDLMTSTPSSSMNTARCTARQMPSLKPSLTPESFRTCCARS